MKMHLFLVLVAALTQGCLVPTSRQRVASPDSTRIPAALAASGELAAALPTAPAQPEITGVALTLSDAFTLAERFHPEIAQARAQVEAAGGRALQAGILPNPTLEARMESAPLQGRTAREAEYVAGFSQTLPLGGRLSTATRVGQLEEKRLEEELALRRLQINSRVHGAFATALFLDEVVKIHARANQIASQGLDAILARLAAGDALPEDLARAEIEQERTLLELERARSLRQQAQSELRAALGNPVLSTLSIQGTLETILELPDIETLAARLADHPLAAVAAAELEAQRARVDLNLEQRIPDVNLDLFYRRLESSSTDAMDVGIAIALPLFDRNQGGVREARAARQAAEARLRATRNELERTLKQAHAQLTRALADARVLRQLILPQSRRILSAVEARLAAGDARLFEVLLVQREHTAVELDSLEALRRVMEAWAELSLWIGFG